MAHAVGLQPERVIERRGGDILEVVGAVVIGSAVEVGGAYALHGIDVAAVEILAAAEHEVLEEVREAGLAGLLVLRADVVPDADGHDGGLVVFVDDDREAVVEDEFFVWDVDAGGLGEGGGTEQEGGEKLFKHIQHIGLLSMIRRSGWLMVLLASLWVRDGHFLGVASWTVRRAFSCDQSQ